MLTCFTLFSAYKVIKRIPIDPGDTRWLSAALHEGIRWSWESFTDYMTALEATPRSLDYLVQVPHDPLRMYVMGERAFGAAGATGAHGPGSAQSVTIRDDP
jgi:hypothetical protein